MEQDEQQQRGELFRASARSDEAMPGRSRYIRDTLDREDPVSQPTSGSGYWGGRSAAAVGGMEQGGGNRQQGPSQQLSWAQVRDGIDIRERQRGVRSAYESVDIGREVLESLDDQKGGSRVTKIAKVHYKPLARQNRAGRKCRRTAESLFRRSVALVVEEVCHGLFCDDVAGAWFVAVREMSFPSNNLSARPWFGTSNTSHSVDITEWARAVL